MLSPVVLGEGQLPPESPLPVRSPLLGLGRRDQAVLGLCPWLLCPLTLARSAGYVGRSRTWSCPVGRHLEPEVPPGHPFSLPFYMSPPGWLLCLVGVGASAGLKLEGRGDLPLFFFSPLFILKSHSFLHPFIHSFSDTVHRPCASPIRSVKVVILVSGQRPRGISWEGRLAPRPLLLSLVFFYCGKMHITKPTIFQCTFELMYNKITNFIL